MLLRFLCLLAENVLGLAVLQSLGLVLVAGIMHAPC